MIHLHKVIRMAICAFCCLVFWAASASASSVYITYESAYTGSVTPASTITPWLAALFEDKPNGDVLLTLSAPNLTGTEYVSKWLFNFTPLKNVNDLVFTVLNDGSANFLSPVLVQGGKPVDFTKADGFHGGGGTIFDIEIPFATSNKEGARFTDDHYSRILISGLNGMDVLAGDFNIPVFKKDVEFISVAHVQALDKNNSAWLKGNDPPPPVATPEPGTIILMGIGALGAAFVRRRMVKTS